MTATEESDIYLDRTRSAFLWTRIMRTPLWAIYCMLPFILFRDLHATPIQIAMAVALKPVVSIFSLYWSSAIDNRRDRLVSNIIWANILGVIPFFFFPYFESPWFFILALGLFMMLHRGVIPAWMEIMKLNLPRVYRQRIFAYATAFGYLGDGVFPFLIGWLMDGYHEAWRWIFPVTAFISLTSILFLIRFPIRQTTEEPVRQPVGSMKEHLLRPWKNSWKLLWNRPDFQKFQTGFMLGGTGLMLMHPVLPVFFMDFLQLSYTELAIALTLCKGIGFALTNQVWAQWMNRVDIYRFSSLVTLLASLFPLCLLAAKSQIMMVYVAYFVYGIMQAGSELSWNLSGPIFAQEEESTVYSGVNVVTVGIRGCVAPMMGTLLGSLWGPSVALMVGGVFCLLATYRMASYSNEYGEAATRAVS